MTRNQSDWQLNSNKITREKIINYFENINADILSKCTSSQAPKLPPGMEEMVSNTMEKATKIEELLKVSFKLTWSTVRI